MFNNTRSLNTDRMPPVDKRHSAEAPIEEPGEKAKYFVKRPLPGFCLFEAM